MKLIQSFILKIKTVSVNPPNRNVMLLAMGIIIGSLLASCGSTTAAPAPVSSAGNQAVPAAQNVPASQNSSATAGSALPGTEEFGMTKEELVKSIEAVESNISTCMRDAGFEYIAVDYKTARQGMVADKSLPGLSEKQFADQYGYGISTLYTGQNPQRADATTPAKIGLGVQNVQIFNNLSPADQVAYNRTLLGEHTDATFAVSLEGENFSRTGGCTRKAIEQVFDPEQLRVTYYNPQDVLIEQDPRMIEALTAYADCMHAAGFDYNHPNEPEPDIRKRLDAITHNAPLDSLLRDAQAALTELQGEERAIAAADYKCRVKLVEPIEDQILSELYSGSQQ